VARALGVPITRRNQGRAPSRPPPASVLSVLPTSYLDEATALSASAFAPLSPSYVYICVSGSTLEYRLRFMEWLFQRNFAMRGGTGCNRCVFDEEGKLLCFFMFVTPGIPDPNLGAMVKLGPLSAPFTFGFGTVRRLLEAKGFFEKVENGSL